MPLEATMICLDNSEYSRNGDFVPNRWESQKDAANLLLDIKTKENPENSVGIVKMGPKEEVLASPNQDQGKLLAVVQNIRIAGRDNNFISTLSVAHLALKHRPNRNQRMRIMVFVGSPITATENQLTSLAKKLKKNNVAVDVISFGDMEQNAQLLEGFMNQVKKADNSHLIQIPPTVSVLADALLGTELLNLAPEQMQQYAEFGGINPELEPELAMAMRISMEEAKAAQQQQQDQTGEQAQPSQQQQQQQPQQEQEVQKAIKLAAEKSEQEIEMDEDEALKRAMQMSMEPGEEQQQKYQEAFHDADFVQNLLGGLQGVDANDPIIQSTLADLRGDKPAESAPEQQQQQQQQQIQEGQEQSQQQQQQAESEENKKEEDKPENKDQQS